MPPLIERLRSALAAEYEVAGELASGGMGIVYRARDIALDRPVAIKLLRPESATAAVAERFLREARILASVRHPCIVPIHRAGEADGLPYYVMDLLEGETLAARIRRGALPPGEVAQVGDDLLSALEVVHARGVVHRDIKPSNVFCEAGRAVLSDFGVATSASAEAEPLTGSGALVGTPAYMAPEQLAGGEVTEKTDVYAVGLVLYEALTARRFVPGSAREGAAWHGVPRAVAPVLARALALAPADRWPGAAAFRRALAGASRGRSRRLARAGAALGLLLVAAAAVWFGRPRPASALRVRIEPLEVSGAAAALGDSLARQIVTALRAAPDVEFRLASDPGASRADVTVTGTLAVRSDSVFVRVEGSGRALLVPFAAPVAAPRAALDRLADSLAWHVLYGVWTGASGSTDLPTLVLPRTPEGLAQFVRGEGFHAKAQWVKAYEAYRTALALDTTCTLCRLRLSDISRWLTLPQDPALIAGTLAHLPDFPPHYRALIRASQDSTDRVGALEAVARREPSFVLAQFLSADEVFHRGPLVGRRRHDALAGFQRTVLMSPEFGPGWEHLAWASIADGDSATAHEALARYARLAAADPYSTLIAALMTAGFAWRFTPDLAPRISDAIMAQDAVAAYRDLGSGARQLVTFDAPAGMVYVGGRFARWPGRPDLAVPGLVMQLCGLVALGRIAEARQLPLRGADAEVALTAGGFQALLAALDSSVDAQAGWSSVQTTLEPVTAEGAATPEQRRRAAWLLALAARRAGEAAAEQRYGALVTGENAPHPLATVLLADSLARAGQPARALAATAPLVAPDPALRVVPDPFFRAALHLLRARWRAATGNTTAAVRELRWHENTDFIGQPATLVQSAEVDWALGTLARWDRARLLGVDEEACHAYADVARLWAGADGARALSAARARAIATGPRCREVS